MASDNIQTVLGEQIMTLISIKENIRRAINKVNDPTEQQQTVSLDTPFADYAGYIESLNPAANANLISKTISSNGTYSASEDNCDGYSSVTVNVTDYESGGGSGGSSGGGAGGGLDDEFEDTNTFTVTFNNPHDPNWERVEVQVAYGGNATFPNDISSIKYYTDGSSDPDPSYEFKEWSPAPDRVESDMTCTAIFVNHTLEIEDSWVKICENRGSKYAIGDFKVMPMNAVTWEIYIPYASNGLIAGIQLLQKPRATPSVKMEKVAEGDGGTTSTWVAREFLRTSHPDNFGNQPGCSMVSYPFKKIPDELLNTPIYKAYPGSDTLYEDAYAYLGKNVTWETSDLRSWMQEILFEAIKEPIKSTIVSIQKESQSSDSLIGVTTTDKLWIPSGYEMLGGTSWNESGVCYPDESGATIGPSVGYTGDPFENNIDHGYWIRSMPNSGAEGYSYIILPYSGSLSVSEQTRSRPIRLGFCL